MARIVFDLDGTLIDSAPDIHAAVNRMLAEQGHAPLDLPTVTSFVGNGLPHLVKLVMQARALPEARHEALTQRVLAHYHTGSTSLTTVYPGVRAALDALAGSHALGVCTNKPLAPAQAILAGMALGPFGVVIGGDSLPQRKPDPVPLQAAFAALGTGARLYVGDSEVDAETAQRAGVPFLLFTKGYRKAPVATLVHSVAFDDFAKLPALAAQLLAEQVG